ncbi:phospholipase D-like domain-containing protein [Noviherbaspirillum denitrificans]|uniref:Cardiolipin synthase B n=1 Tax=Noviherbaspirillum denitrificans TaxID=1968433 RepID=A0A254TK45_9BURK|nr:phospholipase D-like domain-containing protein [Noviherbaspirillum denitrificans]OWW20078.1 cardiolipin synthase B [Noviherbaspirillum denitrificans]
MRPVNFTAHNHVTLLHGGAEFFPALVAAIDAASFEIYLETYIFTLDLTGEAVKDALLRAAGRGVMVNVITDWLGTGHRQSVQLNEALTDGGVNHRVFNSWFRRGLARSHRKICVVDRQVAFLGGLNINHDTISDDGFNQPLPAPRWDLAVCIRGPLVSSIYRDMQAQWHLLRGLSLRHRWEMFRERRRSGHTVGEGPALAAYVVRDNLRNRRTIQKTYLKALGGARKSAMLANPYFAPGRKLRDGLAKAAARGVHVTLLIGVGQFRIQDAVAHSFYPKLLKSGVRIVEYRKTQLHGKVAVIDDEWSTVGSSNWDGLSLLINHEANVVVKDAEFACALRGKIEEAVAEGVTVRLEDYVNIPWYERVWYGAASMLYKGILRIVTLGRYTE